MKNNYAVCTLVSTPNYILGALNLYYSYKLLGLPYDFIIMSPDYMQINYKDIKEDLLTIKFYKEESFQENPVFPRFSKNINKFLMFNYEEYSKILFFDADILFLGKYSDLDYLFNQNVNTFKCFFRVAHEADHQQLLSKMLDYSKLNIYSSGLVLLIRPNKIFFNEILAQKNLFIRDEEVYDYYIYKVDTNNLSEHILLNNDHLLYMHWDVLPKYWIEYPNINYKELIANYTSAILNYKVVNTLTQYLAFKTYLKLQEITNEFT